VREAADGRDALTHALVHPPDLLLTDVGLPLIDGLELCEILRRDRTTAAVPILIITGEARKNVLARAAQSVNTVLIKPATPAAIRAACESLLAEARELRGRAANTSNRAAPNFEGRPRSWPAPVRCGAGRSRR
jgi:CheY-like chemotaxis protein